MTFPLTKIDAAVFERLQMLKSDLRSVGNKHDIAIVMIKACLDEGIVSGSTIVGVLTSLGLNRKHVGWLLRECAGSNPDRHHWKRKDDGTYCCLD